MKLFVSGGAKNGKSSFAQEQAVICAKRERLPLYYIATMLPADAEDRARIARHVKERAGLGFITIEEPFCIQNCLEIAGKKSVFLLDSVTALLANNMFRDGNYNPDAAVRTLEDLDKFLTGVRHAVLVSDYIYSDAHLFDPLTENYRMSLAYVDRGLAKTCDAVYEVICGMPRKVQ